MMYIKEIEMKTFHPAKMKLFYTNVLEMELVSEGENHFSVIAGETKLRFNRDSEMPFYHFCLRTNSLYSQYFPVV
ncbi:hypothetical protein [Chengkuizengella axinellae]|uniref:Uncharacterized protein n=1 Tax=Chengkuizengella axinellae TaxID=3064388 RepID=A0ABT9J4H5_9BACL|nr:hypothetical protein [Chengkuizengella sp. 2205SS18-9]MDP5276535.1 hypothetical protein [Chengkuizengella sp. 2205SS18-9]